MSKTSTKTILKIDNKNAFFAAANSGDGFVSYFDEALRGYEKRLLIKGGPGTGKSYFMKKLGREAARRGIPHEEIYCSSDTSSLDGLLLPTLSLAVVDATAPHSLDPRIPGAYDGVFDMSIFWDENALDENREDIKILWDAKSECYARAYMLLAGARGIRRSARYAVLPLTDAAKIHRAAASICKNAAPEPQKRPALRLCRANSAKGCVMLDSYDRGEKRIVIRDKYGIASLLLAEVTRTLTAKDAMFLHSLDPLDPTQTDAVYIPSTQTSVTVNTDTEDATTVISTERFIDKNAVRSLRQRLNRRNAAFDTAYNEATTELADAAAHHFAIEAYYTAAMDLAAKTEAEDEVIERILDR